MQDSISHNTVCYCKYCQSDQIEVDDTLMKGFSGLKLQHAQGLDTELGLGSKVLLVAMSSVIVSYEALSCGAHVSLR